MLMKNVKKHFHFGFIAVVLAAFVVVSAASLAGLNWFIVEASFSLVYSAVVIPVFFISVFLAARRYSLRASLTVCTVLGASMLALVMTRTQHYSNLHGTIVSLVVGVCVIFWADRERKSREGRDQAAEEVQSQIARLHQELIARQRSEDELVESRRRFRDMSNLLPQIIWEVDTEGNVTFANKQALEAFGYSIGDTDKSSNPPSNAIQAVIPEDRERMRQGIRRVLNGEEVGGVEYTALRKDGSTFPVLIYSARIMRDDRPVGLRGVAIDITERKRTEEKIEHAAKEWRMTFDSATNMISIHDKDFRLTRVNMAFAEAFHMQPKELIGMPCYQVVHGTDRPVAGCPCVKTLATKQPATAEFFDQRLGIHLQVSSSPVFDENGEVLSCVHVASDITERKEMEKALRDSEKNFRNSLYSSPLGVRIVSAQGELLYANRAILDMCGYDSFEELRNIPLSKLYTPESYRQHMEKKQRGEPVPSEYEVSINRRDGEVRHLALFREKVIWDGETQFQELYQDVTELRKAQEQLQHSQLLASLGEMTAGIAHEVNNPLGSVLLYSELLMAGDTPKPLKRDLKVIHDEAKRAARIMTDLLTYSRRMGSQGRRLDLHKVLKKVIDMRHYAQMVRNINVTVDLHDGPLYVVGNSSQLTQLFMNLILNAEEALEELNGGSISISTRMDDEWAKISIADNGPGIPQENLQQIFYPFFTTKPTGKGTGLGLSTCYGIVTALKGLIHAEKNNTGGATFVIELPLAKTRKRKKARKAVAVT